MKYLCDPHILPTNTCPSTFAELEARSHQFTGFTTEIQLDISDGKFSPVTSWPYALGQSEIVALDTLPLIDSLAYEAHLMVENPAALGEALARAGCRRIIAHIETLPEQGAAKVLFQAWRAAGAAEIGIALLIETPLERVDPLIGSIDVVQLMSIAKIGAQGQPFDDRALSRVEELHARHPDLMVAVDGGISEKNVEELVRAGANRLCVGSAISQDENPAAAFARIYERAMRGCAPLTEEVSGEPAPVV